MVESAEANKVSISSNGGSRPVPDPTELTDRAISKATEVLNAKIDALEDATASRMGSAREREAVGFKTIRRESKLLNRERVGQFKAMRELVEHEMAGLAALVNEKFESAERQRLEQKQDTKAAVDAALSAAKEAVKEQTTASERSIAKSEAATSKQLEQQQQTSSTATDGLRRSIEELKERVIEVDRNLRMAISDVATTTNTVVQQKVGAKDDRSAVYAGLAAVGAVVGVILGILAAKGGL